MNPSIKLILPNCIGQTGITLSKLGKECSGTFPITPEQPMLDIIQRINMSTDLIGDLLKEEKSRKE